ncbi:G-type lectin S-receptor-like serine/threonine-protein kinase, partial [Tanacetum coccineum]
DSENSTAWTPEFCYGYDSSDGCVKESSLPPCRREGDYFSEKNGEFDPAKSQSVTDNNSNISISDCFVKCWKDCSCVGFNSSNTNETGCVIWTGSNNFLANPRANSTLKNQNSSRGIYLITIYVLYYPYGDYGRTLGTAKYSANKPMSGIPYCFKRSPGTVNKAPMTECGQRATLNLVERIFYFNVEYNTVTKPLADITFRDSVGDKDMRNHVYRWDRYPFELVFEHGFKAQCQANTPIETYYNLESFVHGARRPLETIRILLMGLLALHLTFATHSLHRGSRAHIS